MAMPLVFGWYPPPNVAPEMNTASIYIQPSMLPSLMSPQSVENPVDVASSEHMETFFSGDTRHHHELGESDEEDDDVADLMEESETDNFFDCEMQTIEDDDEISECTEPFDSQEDARSSSGASINPCVQHVPKRTLQTFDADPKAGSPLPRRQRSTRSNERDLKRNSMSSLQGKSGLPGEKSSKVKKSLSNSDLKLVKPTTIWSTSSFRRVLSPFSSSQPKSSSATNLKRSGSNTSRASLNLEKKRKSETKLDN